MTLRAERSQRSTLRDVWQEAHPLDRWRYDFPGRQMAWWEMPTYKVLQRVRRFEVRWVVLWRLLTTPENTATLCPWEAGGWQRAKCTLAMLLPLPVRWQFPHWPNRADTVLVWWASPVRDTPDGWSWTSHNVGVGYGWSWRVWIFEESA